MGFNFGGQTAPQDIVNIKIFGVGGGGSNAVNRLVSANVASNVEFIAANTDMMALNNVDDKVTKLQLGAKLTHGLGAGSKPDVGEQAALESKDAIKEAISGANLLFLTAGMGGGTGTGGISVVAKIAKEMNILTIAVVTKPFEYEGRRKMQVAEMGIEKLRKEVDVLVVIPNEKAFSFVSPNTPLLKVVQLADDVLHNSIIGITEIVVKPALMNLDFADIDTVIRKMGTAHIGIGKAKGENRVLQALKQAAASPLLESNITGATQLIVSVTADLSVNGNEVREALKLITNVAADDANIITGLGFEESLKDEVQVTIIATGFDGAGDSLPNIPSFEDTQAKEKSEIADSFTTPPINTNILDEVAASNIEDKEIEEKAVPGFLQRIKKLRNN
ncbi:MAG: cell division protein FtsZ [Clostridiales bacterium]|nr:cell division protein FtsZ [Clostridiales bacterium]